MACIWGFVRSKRLAVVSTKIEIKKEPQRAVAIAMALPIMVCGETSPYPTVVIVIVINQNPPPREFTANKVSFTRLYGRSKISKSKLKNNIEHDKMVIADLAGLVTIYTLKVNLTPAVNP